MFSSVGRQHFRYLVRARQTSSKFDESEPDELEFVPKDFPLQTVEVSQNAKIKNRPRQKTAPAVAQKSRS